MNEEMDEVEEMKKFEQGFAYRFQVDSIRVNEWLTCLKAIHTALIDDHDYIAGFLLAELQNNVYNTHKDLVFWEKKEKLKND